MSIFGQKSPHCVVVLIIVEGRIFFCALQPKFYPGKEDVAWKAAILWSVGQKPQVDETSFVLVKIRARNQNEPENDSQYQQVMEAPG